ncbi:ABC transporter permease [Deinococcus misasensis]|uniref:ABC transporter permease n=1 Tax=Deinococcus misasensis TaxID=392413 RepID=UPI0005516836|nr:ABC transporter permease [Deinococcus misasensis]
MIRNPNPPKPQSFPWKNLLDQSGTLLVLVLMVVLFSIFRPAFGTFDNLMLIGLAASVVAIVAAGQTFVILTGGIDLSVGSVVGLSGVIAAGLMKGSFGYASQSFTPLNPWLAILVGILLGAFVGFLHGILITRLKLPPFIVTLGTLSALKGLALTLTSGSPIQGLPETIKWISDGTVLRVPVPTLIALSVFALCALTLKYTRFGRYVYAIGGNEEAVKLTGIHADRVKIGVYMLSSVLSALAGMILISRLDSGIFTNGVGYELTAITGVVIGGTSLAGGLGSIWGSLVGVLIMAVVNNALVHFSVNPLLNEVVIGCLIVLAVTLDRLRHKN